MRVEYRTFFGCALRDLTTQLGLNQNPTVWTFSVARDVGQVFTLANEAHEGIRRMEHLTLGALDMWGVVQSWDEQKLGIGGSGLYNVRVTDMRPAMDGVEVFLHAPLDMNLGQNVIPVYSETGDDINSGIKYTRIKATIEATTLSYGDIRFRVSLARIAAPDRSVGGERIPYRIRGGALSLVSLIQQISDDNGWDWRVETPVPDADEIHTVTVVPILRQVSILNMKGLAAHHAGAVIRLNEGTEARDEVTRTVIVGAPQQYLSHEPAANFYPFWGFTEDGKVLDHPEFQVLTLNSKPRRRQTTTEEMERALNGEIKDLPEDELSAPQVLCGGVLGQAVLCQSAAAT